MGRKQESTKLNFKFYISLVLEKLISGKPQKNVCWANINNLEKNPVMHSAGLQVKLIFYWHIPQRLSYHLNYGWLREGC